MELWQKYQLEKTSRTKEGIEWSSYYAYNAPDDTSPRVFLIGDSICYGYQDAVRRNLEGKVNVSYWASSKCVTDPMYLRHLDFFMDQNKYDLIIRTARSGKQRTATQSNICTRRHLARESPSRSARPCRRSRTTQSLLP